MNYSNKLKLMSAVFLISLTLFTLPAFAADFNINAIADFDAGNGEYEKETI